AVFKIRSDARSPEGVTAGRRGEAGRKRSPFYHAQHVGARHRIEGYFFVSIYTAEEGTFLFISDAGGIEICVDVCFGIMMRGHFVPLAALLMQSNPVAFALRVIVLDAHVNGGADTS